jgi:hypothetical protein
MQAKPPAATPPNSSNVALLDQLPPVDLNVRGRPLTQLLRTAYLNFGDTP